MNGWEYMTKNAAVIPFAPNTVVYVDGMLSTCYYESKKAGILEKVMCGDNPNHDHFVRMFDESKKVLQILCEVEDVGTEKENAIPVGYCWVELPKGVDGARAAMCGFAFFKKTRLLKDLGLLGLGYWFKGLKISVVHGVLLESNEPAKRYAEDLGFVETAVVPEYHFFEGKLVGARAMICRADDFLPTYDKWFEENRVSTKT